MRGVENNFDGFFPLLSEITIYGKKYSKVGVGDWDLIFYLPPPTHSKIIKPNVKVNEYIERTLTSLLEYIKSPGPHITW